MSCINFVMLLKIVNKVVDLFFSDGHESFVRM